MGRKNDHHCRACNVMLQLDEERYCGPCSAPSTRKALSQYYTRKTEKDERVVKSVPLRKCQTPKCQNLAEDSGVWCKYHKRDSNAT